MAFRELDDDLWRLSQNSSAGRGGPPPTRAETGHRPCFDSASRMRQTVVPVREHAPTPVIFDRRGLWDVLLGNCPELLHQQPHIGRPRCDPRRLFNGILYVLTTGCTWHDVPAKYGTKSTVHRYHLELCEKGVYQAIFLDLLRSGYAIRKIDLSDCATDTKAISAKKRDRPAMMAIKR